MGAFQMPNAVKIMHRLSSITNSFVNGIIPSVQPADSEILQALQILSMTPDNVRCAYCGDRSTEWDHLRPIVQNRRPTGYISEIRNLVPACGKCNQSKGNREWRSWMLGPAPLSPKKRGIADLEEKVKRLESYESQGGATKLDIPAIVGEEDWMSHLGNLKVIEAAMKEAQKHSAILRERIHEKMSTRAPKSQKT